LASTAGCFICHFAETQSAVIVCVQNYSSAVGAGWVGAVRAMIELFYELMRANIDVLHTDTGAADSLAHTNGGEQINNERLHRNQRQSLRTK